MLESEETRIAPSLVRRRTARLSQPVVSVVMNAYESREFFAEALASALNQTLNSIEVVVWDNSSIDPVKDIVDEFADPRIRYVHHNERVSLYRARVLAVGECRGDFVAFLDCDDVWRSDKLELQIQTMEDCGSAASCTSYFHVSESGEIIDVVPTYSKPLVTMYSGLIPYQVGMSTLVARRKELMAALPGQVPDWFIIEDLDIAFRLLQLGPMSAISEPLTSYRIHNSNTFRDKHAYVREVDEWLTSSSEHLNEAGLYRPVARHFRTLSLRDLTRDHLHSSRRREALSTWHDMPLSVTKAKWLLAVLFPALLKLKPKLSI